MYTDIYIMLFYIRYENKSKNNFSFGCNAGMNETKKKKQSVYFKELDFSVSFR